MAPMKSPPHHDVADEQEESITLTHLAQRWHVSRREVRRLLQSGKLPFEEVAGQIRVPLAAVLVFESAKELSSEVQTPRA